MERTAAARAYYAALDEHDYDRLADLLAPEFVHDRPDQTIEGRERFVRFMREERPQTDTSHPLTAVYEDGEGGDRVAAEGRLLDADGEEITSFVDVFAFGGEDIEKLVTYTR